MKNLLLKTKPAAVGPVLSLSIVYPQSLPKIPLVGNTSFGGVMNTFAPVSPPNSTRLKIRLLKECGRSWKKKLNIFFTQKGIGTLKITVEI
jgi:hypothetical protein